MTPDHASAPDLESLMLVEEAAGAPEPAPTAPAPLLPRDAEGRLLVDGLRPAAFGRPERHVQVPLDGMPIPPAPRRRRAHGGTADLFAETDTEGT